MGEFLKLSQASKVSGVSVGILRRLVDDGLLPVAGYAGNSHPLLSEDSVPTWDDCRPLVLQQRDRHLQQTSKMLERVQVEIEAVHNDIVEARENRFDVLGVDLMVSGSYAHSGQTTLATALQNLDLARMQVVIYHRALTEFTVAWPPAEDL